LSGKLTGKPRGGEAGRQILRLWQTEAMAMPGFPMNFSKSDRAILMASSISRYAAIGETVTEKQANDAVKNMKNSFLKKNQLHRDELPFCSTASNSNPSGGNKGTHREHVADKTLCTRSSAEGA
jgi:hypothetical protein